MQTKESVYQLGTQKEKADKAAFGIVCWPLFVVGVFPLAFSSFLDDGKDYLDEFPNHDDDDDREGKIE